jgi:hypothetical protein
LLALGFVIVNDRVVVPPTGINAGENALASVGGLTASAVAGASAAPTATANNVVVRVLDFKSTSF